MGEPSFTGANVGEESPEPSMIDNAVRSQTWRDIIDVEIMYRDHNFATAMKYFIPIAAIFVILYIILICYVIKSDGNKKKADAINARRAKRKEEKTEGIDVTAKKDE
jgi:hypothetical protein